LDLLSARLLGGGQCYSNVGLRLNGEDGFVDVDSFEFGDALSFALTLDYKINDDGKAGILQFGDSGSGFEENGTVFELGTDFNRYERGFNASVPPQIDNFRQSRRHSFGYDFERQQAGESSRLVVGSDDVFAAPFEDSKKLHAVLKAGEAGWYRFNVSTSSDNNNNSSELG